MKRHLLLPAVYLIDVLAGDPESLPHPVRLIGKAVTNGESLLRSPGQSDGLEFVSGMVLTIALVSSAYCVTDGLIEFIYRRSKTSGIIAELCLGWTCLAARSLDQEAGRVLGSLTDDDLKSARLNLARIVGRDTGDLNEREISRAVIETLAESASDGVIAPIFYMSLGGVPLAMAYKAINTLDSMIGHADERYVYFGKFAARLDDVANFVPSRLTALGIIAASTMSASADANAALRTWRRDGSRHKSPNAGQPESAMSGALQVQLGGNNTYTGELIPAPIIGFEFSGATPAKAMQARHLVSLVCALGIAAGALVALIQGKPRVSTL
ncbi:adenosylcobinamide-phosphate synthase CbiB [Granulicella arctica]|uniref:adenosylcobinamide-phosphate synthase CbiB n=1 Tax=Granulicella arctica TaxID=940613 RepID=UPI0021E09E31|nr:adenosylcobinamide-phosphate synthase CbiB [Granulicella arctica]